MRSKKKLLCLLLAIATMLLAALLVLRREEEEEQETESPERTSTALCADTAADITSVRITRADGADTVEIVRADGVLVLSGYEQYQQDQAQMLSLYSSLAGLTGTVVQEGDFDADRYGLGDTRTVIELTGSAEQTLYLGNYNEGTSTWYLMCEGDETLYTIPSGSGDKLSALPWAYLGADFIEAFDSDEDEMTERLTRVRIERPDLTDPLVIEATGETGQAYTSAYEITEPVQVRTSYKTMNEKIASLFGFAADSVEGRWQEEDRAEYGFEEPAMVMTVDHDGTTDTFTVGGEASDGVRYLLWSGSDLLYRISESSLAFLDVDIDDLFFGLALLPEIDTVGQVDLTMNGASYCFKLEWDEEGTLTAVTLTEASAEEAPGGADVSEEETPDSAELAGNELSLDVKQFRVFYSFLLELDVQSVQTEEEDGEERLSLTYHYLDGTSDTIEEIALEDGRTAGVLVNGKMSFTGRLAYIEKLETELGHLIAGEEVDTNW